MPSELPVIPTYTLLGCGESWSTLYAHRHFTFIQLGGPSENSATRKKMSLTYNKISNLNTRNMRLFHITSPLLHTLLNMETTKYTNLPARLGILTILYV